MNKRLFSRLLAAILSVSISVGALSVPSAAKAEQAYSQKIAPVSGFVFDGTESDFELIELQQAYLRGLIPAELVGDINRDITQAEFRRYFSLLMKYMDITPAQDMEYWLSEGADTAITRGTVTDEFLWAYYVFMNKPFELLSMSNVQSTNIYCNGPSEVLERNGEDSWLVFYTHNTDYNTGAPLMDRDLDGYLRLEDNMTVKETVQLMYRFSNCYMPDLEYVSLSEIRTPITLTKEELRAAKKMPSPTYSELPKYHGIWYWPGGVASIREDAVYETDFSTLSDMGFNFIRYSLTQDMQNKLMDENGNICLSNVESLCPFVPYF